MAKLTADEKFVLRKLRKGIEDLISVDGPDPGDAIEQMEDMLNSIVWNRQGGMPQVKLRQRFGDE